MLCHEVPYSHNLHGYLFSVLIPQTNRLYFSYFSQKNVKPVFWGEKKEKAK